MRVKDKWNGSIKIRLQRAANTLQKTCVQTFRASFAPRTLAAHCGQRKKKEVVRMARLKYFVIYIAIFVLSCASIPVSRLTSGDIEDLKGRWKGYQYLSSGAESVTQSIEMKIFNKNLEGEISFHGSSQSYTYPLVGGTAPSDNDRINRIGYCRIEDEKFVIFWEKERWTKLNYYKGDNKMRLEGDFLWRQWKGTVSLNKVR